MQNRQSSKQNAKVVLFVFEIILPFLLYFSMQNQYQGLNLVLLILILTSFGLLVFLS